MDQEMLSKQLDQLLQNTYIETLAYFSVAVLALVLFLALFEWVTRYRAWDQIRQGNVAVAMAVGGKIFGICNIFRFAMQNRAGSLYDSFIWAGFGFLLLLAAYFIFEFLTPVFKVDEQLEKGNQAVGLVSLAISVALSYVIGASIR
ncbi:DUF350 domain-containing protein [Marinicrinis lubricantis]|uniref:DUF350 domain-containing protein n=1 Tax=Marinicrinis lubricantis TaxID=2086470 RepID=A0ABW1ILI4_9BACL